MRKSMIKQVTTCFQIGSLTFATLMLPLFSPVQLSEASNLPTPVRKTVPNKLRPFPPFPRPSTRYLSAIEKEIIAEMNRIRQNPSAYAAKLKKWRTSYRGKVLMAHGMPPMKTDEGVAAVNDAIAALSRMKPRKDLKASLGLSLAARDHAQDLSRHKLVGHIGSDGSTPFIRISRYGKWNKLAGENISYSPVHSARWHVMQLIIDDGVSRRSHREAILRNDYQFAGVACRKHPAFENVCVITYAVEFQEKGPRLVRPSGPR